MAAARVPHGPPGIGKMAIMEQIASELGVGLVSYSMTHHTRQSALGLPFIVRKTYGGREYDVSEYTMSEIIASVYDLMEDAGVKEGMLGHISVEQFQTLSGCYTEEQEKLAAEIPVKEAAIQKLRDTVSSTDGVIAKAKRCTDITELMPELLQLFIQKIVVHKNVLSGPRTRCRPLKFITMILAAL